MNKNHEFWCAQVKESLEAIKGGRFVVCDVAMKFPVREVADALDDFEYFVFDYSSSPYVVVGQECIAFFDRFEQKNRIVPLKLPLR